MTFCNGPRLANLPHHVAERIERNFPFAKLLLLFLHLRLIKLLLRLLDQRQHVPHAQNAARHPIRMELFQII